MCDTGHDKKRDIGRRTQDERKCNAVLMGNGRRKSARRSKKCDTVKCGKDRAKFWDAIGKMRDTIQVHGTQAHKAVKVEQSKGGAYCTLQAGASTCFLSLSVR